MICPECGVSDRLAVDGRGMSEWEMLQLSHAPKEIKRTLHHAVTCTRLPLDERVQLVTDSLSSQG